MNTAKELERWKKTAENQRKEIQRLKEAIEGYENGQSGIYAMIVAVVQKAGTVTITRDEINEIIREGRQPRILLDTKTWTYTLSMEGQNDGNEG